MRVVAVAAVRVFNIPITVADQARHAQQFAPMRAARSGRLTKAARQLRGPTATGRSMRCLVGALCRLISL
jgi:hypothetical protein